MGFGSRGGFGAPAATLGPIPPPMPFSPAINTPTKTLVAVAGITFSPALNTPTKTLTT
mgnify:CR=1 FL=1